MTITMLITANAILGVAVVYGLILLLTHGIRSGRAGGEAEVRTLPQRGADRLAA